MPGRDGTGPAGSGPMTGRGLGFCAVDVNQNSSRMASFLGAYGRGRGGGRGYKNFYYATGLPGFARYSMGLPAWGNIEYSPNEGNPFLKQNIDLKQEGEVLKNQAEFLSKQLNDIQTRISALDKQKEAGEDAGK